MPCNPVVPWKPCAPVNDKLFLYTILPLPFTSNIFVSDVPIGTEGNFILPVNEPVYENILPDIISAKGLATDLLLVP